MSVVVMVYETDIEGHHLDYIEHLCASLLTQGDGWRAVFVVHPDFWAHCTKAGKERLFRHFADVGIEFRPITQEEHCTTRVRPEARGAFAKWAILTRYARLVSASHVLILRVDHFQLPLACMLPLPKSCTISGLLFRPTVHYRSMFGNRLSVQEQLTALRKRFFYGCMLRRRDLTSLYSLDPYFIEYASRTPRYKNKLHFVHDPSLFETRVGGDAESVKTFVGVRKTFLLFGYLSRRKGILETIDAISMLPDEIVSQSRFIFAGRMDNSIRGYVQSKVELLNAAREGVEIRLLNRYVPDDELAGYLKAADYILLPYIRYPGSSGGLLWAAGAGKPVLTENFGLLGRWVKDNRLGVTVDTRLPSHIAAGIVYLMGNAENEFDAGHIKSFAQEYTPARFALDIFLALRATMTKSSERNDEKI